MLLLAQQLLSQSEEANDFASQLLGLSKALRIKQDFCDELVIRDTHCDWSEELLEVIGKSRPTPVPFSCGVESHENA